MGVPETFYDYKNRPVTSTGSPLYAPSTGSSLPGFSGTSIGGATTIIPTPTTPSVPASPYSSHQGYQTAYNRVIGNTGAGGFQWNPTNTSNKLNSYGDSFNSLFQNYVGRAPTQAEFEQFWNGPVNDILNSGAGLQNTQTADANSQFKQFIGDTFQQQANQTATQKLADQNTEAGSLADQFMAMGTKTLGDISSSLADYQTRLFDRLKPNLSYIAQNNGTADSGGQVAQEQGALYDLGTQAMGALLPLQQQIEQGANQIRFGGASAPYYFQQAQIQNQPSTLATLGQNAMSQNWQNYLQGQDYTRQAALANYDWTQKNNLMPSLLSTLGQNFASSFGKDSGSAASTAGQNLFANIPGMSALFG